MRHNPHLRHGLGLYLAVPFCRSKCSYCNFASQVFPAAAYREYAELLAREIRLAAAADGLEGAQLDTIYWGGGTPTLLPPDALALVGNAIREHFSLAPGLEHTVEAAPGTLTPQVVEGLVGLGVNRLSFGVQSMHDEEARAVGRLHTRATVLGDLERARAAGITNLNLDFILGLPHQTLDSWRQTLELACATGAPHLSLYMLEVDDDSRLGRELQAGGVRYHAHSVPDDDHIAAAYEWACPWLEAAGWLQYEISNFARPGFESRHNQGYWTRRPYLGVGLDAHSFLPPRRFANPDELGAYVEPLRAGRLPRLPAEEITAAAACEEHYFLGLRRNAGVCLLPPLPPPLAASVARLVAEGLLTRRGDRIALTAHGRLLSNRVFTEFLGAFAPAQGNLVTCEADSVPRA